MMPDELDWIDISPVISPSLAVFPGDVPFSEKWSQRHLNGAPYSLSSITTTLHIGAHADAPYHYHSKGQTIEQRSLDFYVGRCQVLNLNQKGGEIDSDEIDRSAIQCSRLLVRTDSFSNPKKWRSDFRYFSERAIDCLHELGVRTLGIDTPSIDAANSKELRAHQRVFQHDLAILEGLTLSSAPEGFYTLIALPLRIAGADASPVRAILIKCQVPFAGHR